jgi:hypothetical protein
LVQSFHDDDEASARSGELNEKGIQLQLRKLEAALHIVAYAVEAIFPPLQVYYLENWLR